MERFGWRGFCEIVVAGILLLTVGYFAAREHTVTKEYHEYRAGIFARAYESLIDGLGHYTEEGDVSLVARLADRFAELPLSERESSTVRQFLSDLSAGNENAEAKKRADAYAEELLRYLSAARRERYNESWRASGMGLPPYPEISAAVGLHPKDPIPEDDTASLAAALLGSRFVRYTRRDGDGTVIGYRSAIGYAEYRDGCLFRALIYRTVGGEERDGTALGEDALRLLAAQGYPVVTVDARERRGQTVLITAHTEQLLLRLDLTKDRGELRRFWVEPIAP